MIENDPPGKKWFRYRYGLLGLILDVVIERGYNGLFVDGHPLPTGTLLERDNTHTRPTGLATRMLRDWHYDAVLSAPRWAKGYLVFRLKGDPKWHIRTRELIYFDDVLLFRMHLSHEEMRVALIDANGEEVPLTRVKYVPTNDPSIAGIPLY